MTVETVRHGNRASLQLYSKPQDLYYRKDVLIRPATGYGGVPHANAAQYQDYQAAWADKFTIYYGMDGKQWYGSPAQNEWRVVSIDKIAHQVYTIRLGSNYWAGKLSNSGYGKVFISDPVFSYDETTGESYNPYWNFEKIHRGVYLVNGNPSYDFLIEEVAPDTVALSMGISGSIPHGGQYDRNELAHHWVVDYDGQTDKFSLKNAHSGSTFNWGMTTDEWISLVHDSDGPDIIENDIYQIVNMAKGQVLDVFAFNPDDGAPVVLWEPNNYPNQQFQAEYLGLNLYQFKAQHSGGKYLSIDYTPFKPNPPISSYVKQRNSTNTIWRMDPVNEYGVYRMENAWNGISKGDYIRANYSNNLLSYKSHSLGQLGEFRLVEASKQLKGLHAHYPLDTDAGDISGNGLNGTLHNGVSFVNDPERGQVASFDGTDDFISLHPASDMDFEYSSFTVSAWVRVEAFGGTTDETILGTALGGGTNKSLHLVLRNQHPYMGFYANDLSSDAVINQDEWNHIVWRYNIYTRERHIFVNGVLKSSDSAVDPFVGDEITYIGSWEHNHYFKGRIDDVKIWRHAINDDEVLGEYDSSVKKVIGETGILPAVDHNFQTVQLSRSYANPVVVISPVSFNGGFPAITVVKNVQPESFDVALREWDFYDGIHNNETLHYMVIEEGLHSIEGGYIQAGIDVSVNHQARPIGVAPLWSGEANRPALLAQVMTVNGSNAVVPRVDIAAGGSSGYAPTLWLQEQEANDHMIEEPEKVGWVLMTGGYFTDGTGELPNRFTTTLSTTLSSDIGTVHWNSFGPTPATPLIFAMVQTFNDSDPVGLRYYNVVAEDATAGILLQEEKSLDDEIHHNFEDIEGAVFDGPQLIIASGLMIVSGESGQTNSRTMKAKAKWLDDNAVEEERDGLVLYPNPTDNSISLDFYLDTADEVRTRIVDLSGKELLDHIWKLGSGNNTITLKDLKTKAGIRPGLYILKIEAGHWADEVPFIIE